MITYCRYNLLTILPDTRDEAKQPADRDRIALIV
jgi:hypothetical protein